MPIIRLHGEIGKWIHHNHILQSNKSRIHIFNFSKCLKTIIRKKKKKGLRMHACKHLVSLIIDLRLFIIRIPHKWHVGLLHLLAEVRQRFGSQHIFDRRSPYRHRSVRAVLDLPPIFLQIPSHDCVVFRLIFTICLKYRHLRCHALAQITRKLIKLAFASEKQNSLLFFVLERKVHSKLLA